LSIKSMQVNRTIIYLILSILIFVLLAWIFTDILAYFIISIVIAALLKPVVEKLSKTQFLKIRLPRAFAVFLSFVIFSGVISLFFTLFIPVVSAQIDVLSSLDYENIFNKISEPLTRIENFLIDYNLTENANGFILEELRNSMVNLVKELKIQNILNTFLSLTGNLFIGGMAILFITFFLLYETTTIRKRMLSLIPNAYFEVTISAFNKIEKLFSNYLLGLLVQMFAIFSVASIGLTLVGVNYALTIAFFAAVANLIPYLGPLLGSLFGIFVAISTQLGNLTPQENIFLVVKIAVVFAVVQIMDNLIFQPLIFSKSLRAHPLEIFVVIFAGAALGRLIVGGLLGGVLGMISAIPFYTILRVSGQELYSGYRQYKVFRN